MLIIMILVPVAVLMLGSTAARGQPHPSSTGSAHVSTGSSTTPSELSSRRNLDTSPSSTTTIATNPMQPVHIALDEVTRTARPQLPLKVSGRLVLLGPDRISNPEIRIELGRSVYSRSDLANLRDKPGAAAGLSYPTMVASQTMTSPLVSGALPEVFATSTNPNGLNLPAALRVYPLRITATGIVNGQRKVVGTTYTFLVWAPVDVTAPTPVSVVLPLSDVPRLRSDGRLTDDGLADLVAPGGRLDRLLGSVVPAAGQQAPTVALAVDPILIQTLKIMASGPYEVATPSGPSPRRPNRNAATFLANLKAFADAGGTVFALPYGDVDVVALTRADKFHNILLALLTGRTVIANAIGRSPDTSIAYPDSGLIDPTTLDLLRRMGITTVVTDSRLLPPRDPEKTYTASAVAEIPTSGGTVRALATEQELTQLATTTSDDSGSPTQSESFQNLIATVASITAERPGLARVQTLALPRYWDPPAGWAHMVLDNLTTPFSRLVPVTWTPPVGPTVAGSERGSLVYPEWAHATELTVARIRATEDLRDQVQALKSVLCPGNSATAGTQNCQQAGIDGMENTLTSSESVVWRADAAGPGGADMLSTGVAGAVRGIRDGIRVVASHSVSLTSKHGKVPVTLENNTAFTINVTLSLASTDHTRLRSATGVKLIVSPLQKVQVEVEVDAEAAGTFPVDIQILTPAGRPLSADPPLRILVKSTVFGVIAVAITGGALAVLAFAVVFRLIRRLRAMRGGTPSRPTGAPSLQPAGVCAAQDPATPSAPDNQPGQRPGGDPHRFLRAGDPAAIDGARR